MCPLCLQAASFFHNLSREKQLEGLAAGKPKLSTEVCY
jgi:hypothetical protein